MLSHSERRFSHCRWSSDSIRSRPCSFVPCAGTTIEFTYGMTPRLNGRPIDYSHWLLFGGPFEESEVDSQKLILKHGALRRVLDFNNLTVVDR